MINVDQTISEYVSLRDHLSELRNDFKEKEKEIKKRMGVLEADILEFQRKTGLQSASNRTHTAFQTTKTYVRVADWDDFSKYVLETGNIHLLEKRVAKLAALEIFKEEGIDPSQIGLHREDEIVVQIRKR